MFVIIFPAGKNLPVPIVGQAQFLLLTGHIVNVGISPFCRRSAMLNRCIFCRHAEGIKSHGMDNVKSLHFLEAGHHITDGIVSYMAHMKVTGGIREHLQNIVFLFRRIRVSLECLCILPDFLPFFLNLLRNILFTHNFTFHKNNDTSSFFI